MADPIRVILNGAAGRMGRAILSLLADEDDMTLAGALEHPDHPSLGTDVGEAVGLESMGIPITAEVGEGDVLIDFSTPASTLARAETCSLRGVALVIGTTGLEPDHMEKIREASRRVPCVQSFNMSLGIALATRIVADLARALPAEFDIEIIETHHRHKKDAPSGTALRLGRAAAQARGLTDACFIFGRRGMGEGRSRGEIGIHAIRVGEETGEHRVVFGGSGEMVEIRHQARTREAFAAGAIRAARFVHDRNPGLYDISDVVLES